MPKPMLEISILRKYHLPMKIHIEIQEKCKFLKNKNINKLYIYNNSYIYLYTK